MNYTVIMKRDILNVTWWLLTPFILTSILIVTGWTVVPNIAVRDIAVMLALLVEQVVIATLLIKSPFSYRHWRKHLRLVLVVGSSFALAYIAILLSEFTPAINIQINVIVFFMLAALVVGGVVYAKERRIWQSVVTSAWSLMLGTAFWSTIWLVINYVTWNSSPWHFFWSNEGTMTEFHRAGASDFLLFVLQDIHGALFFHPILSAVIGAFFGLFGACVVKGILLSRS